MNFITSYIFSPLTLAAFVIGIIMGSFANVCIYRIPKGTFFKTARSHCPHCGTLIPFYFNIPILSYLFLLGKARCCGERVSAQYPIIESLVGLLFVACYWKYPFVVHGGAGATLDYADLLRFVHLAFFSTVLVICSVIDLDLMIIPDAITFPMVGMVPVVVFFHPDLDWKSSLIGLLLGGGLLYGVAWLYWILRKEEGMGLGDVKLLAVIGGWLGYQAVLPTIFLGSIIGSLMSFGIMIFSRRLNLKTAIPFGPFLAVGSLLHIFFGRHFHEMLIGFG